MCQRGWAIPYAAGTKISKELNFFSKIHTFSAKESSPRSNGLKIVPICVIADLLR